MDPSTCRRESMGLLGLLLWVEEVVGRQRGNGAGRFGGSVRMGIFWCEGLMVVGVEGED